MPSCSIAAGGGPCGRFTEQQMKRILFIGTLTLAAVPLVASSANAQDTLSRAGTVARTPSYNSLLTAIEATQSATDKVKSRTVTATDIRVVDANSVIGADNDATVKAALDTHKDHLATLRTVIGTNPAYVAALAGHKDKPMANDVIAVDIMNDGDVLVYFRK